MSRKSLIAVAGLFLLSGCAAVMEGTTQDISVNTTPEGANCSFVRNGASLGAVLSTPATFHVDKTKDGIAITCNKAGYQPTTYLNASGAPKNNLLYILVGGPAGWGYDSAVGADNLYTSPVTLELKK